MSMHSVFEAGAIQAHTGPKIEVSPHYTISKDFTLDDIPDHPVKPAPQPAPLSEHEPEPTPTPEELAAAAKAAELKAREEELKKAGYAMLMDERAASEAVLYNRKIEAGILDSFRGFDSLSLWAAKSLLGRLA
jgi:hypothetical protein